MVNWEYRRGGTGGNFVEETNSGETTVKYRHKSPDILMSFPDEK